MAQEPEKTEKTEWQGKTVEIVPVSIEKLQEHVQTYNLGDGTKLYLRVVMIQVARVVGQYDPEGNPIYLMKHNIIVTADAPQNLMEKRDNK